MTPQKMDLADVHNLSEKEMLVVIMTTLNSVCDACTATSDHLKTLNGRVGRLENWKAYISGGLAIVAIGVSIFAGYVLTKL